MTDSSSTHLKQEIDEDDPRGESKNPATFSSNIGLICSCLGCVVGTGNIWRFPRVVAKNSGEKGGLVFLMVWVVFLFLWSVPMLIVEYSTGRYSKKALVGSFRHFLGDKAIWCGGWITMVTFFISCYYSVILGWCFYYFFRCVAYELPEGQETSKQIFDDFTDSAWPVLTHAIAVTLAGLCVLKNVKSIEKANLFLVPTFLFIIVFTFYWSLTRPNAGLGIQHLFSPDWDSFGDPRLWVDAISQNAFDTGAGMGLIVPYATFMTRNHGIVRYGSTIPIANNLVSLICGIIVISTVFSSLTILEPGITHVRITEILKESGPAYTGLTFIWIPVLFSTAGGFGRFIAVLFFLCLSFAGLSSLISNVELAAHTLEDFGAPRKYGVPLTVSLIFLLGLPSAVNLEFLTNQDFVWGFGLLISGLMFQYMVVRYGVKLWREDIINLFGTDDWKLPKVWEWVIRIIAPLEAVIILAWWAIDLISDENSKGEKWYQFGTETFMSTIIQWISVILLLAIANVIYIMWKKRDPERKSLLSSYQSSTSLGDKSGNYDKSYQEVHVENKGRQVRETTKI